MASFRGVPVVLASIVVAVIVVTSTADPDVSLMASSCDGFQIDLVEDYAQARRKALDDAVSKTPYNKFDYQGEGTYNSEISFSHGKCTGEDNEADCLRCLQLAEMRVLGVCLNNAEGWAQLKDCYLGFFQFKM